MMMEDPKIRNLLDVLGHTSLYPPQEQAISYGLLEGKNLLVTSPTASGKTLIAIMAAIKAFEKGLKVFYLTPLRALATEKYNDLRVLERLNILKRKIRIKLASSDYDSTARELEEADVLVLTNEKMDSLIRHGTSWISDVGLFVVDEVHLIGERERGPTLEMILTIIRKVASNAQILALSATVSNSADIAKWLDCHLIETNWRPTKLFEGVYEDGTILMNDGNRLKIQSYSDAAIDLAIDSIDNGGQALIFAGTRKRACSLAAKAAETVLKRLDRTDKGKANIVSLQIRTKGEDLELTNNLSKLVSKGVAFHHAGLGANSREIVEEAFKTGVIKLIVATPTLASGVNLPARRVVLSSVVRYDANYGQNLPISVLEYKQLCGRAGRPKYDTFGEAIIVAESGLSSTDLYEHYILGEAEPVRSQLINDKALRVHLLSIISTIPGMKQAEIYDLFGTTLCAQNFKKEVVVLKIDSVLRYLQNENLIKSKNERYIPTNFGRRSSLLYIDPLTAVDFKRAIESMEETNANDVYNHALGFLHLITSCSDFYPRFSMRKKDLVELAAIIGERRNELLFPINEFECSRSLLALYAWIHEASDRTLSDRLAVEPGDMHRMIEIADWLVHSLYDVAKLLRRRDLLGELHNLQIRIRYGIREELIPLVRLKDIGRARARVLYDAGIVDARKVIEIPEAKLSSIPKIGPTLAKRLKEQLKKERQ
ncbi:MAG TPA: DEAD/DEAH box helicase [Candidatus Bathyarchaeia archaeon]|nr:DEAD/DEAH box helicase [Candidatus Bathyarchaeia archaeon]